MLEEWESAKVQLRPSVTYADDLDGTEPHLFPHEAAKINDAARANLSVCQHCGGYLDENPHEHIEPEPFDFWQFAPTPPKSGAKPSSKTSKSKAAQAPKAPKFDPSQEALVKVLEGKLRIRIEIHHAEDIRHLLKIMELYPMEAVLEGLTEGYLVAKELAAAKVDALLFGDIPVPKQESSGGSGLVGFDIRRIPIQFRSRFRIPQLAAGPPSLGEESLANAAILAEAGVKVAISASSKGQGGTPQLSLAAAKAASFGLDKALALRAITEYPAKMLGLGEELGQFKKGLRASFLVLNGAPFEATTSVQSIYVDGERCYKRKK